MPVLPSGTRITPARLSLVERKPGNTSRASTIAHTDDPNLSIPVVANAAYVGRCVLFLNAGSVTGDLSVRFTMPAGSGISAGVLGLSAGAANQTGELTAPMIETSTSPTGAMVIGCVGGFTVAVIEISLIVGGTAGALTLQWAQAVSDPGATVVHQRSYLKLERVA